MYIVTKCGVHRQIIIGLYETLDEAFQTAVNFAVNDIDDWHKYNVNHVEYGYCGIDNDGWIFSVKQKRKPLEWRSALVQAIVSDPDPNNWVPGNKPIGPREQIAYDNYYLSLRYLAGLKNVNF